tara:strand:+ start:7362 stop:7589 length:228 start_codon:yes stop_codon:yes gene_type:complete
MLDPNNIEDLQSIEKCRNIVTEILKFGVKEIEIKKIIGLLSLELEDINCMRSIQSVLKNENQQQEVVEKKENLIL